MRDHTKSNPIHTRTVVEYVQTVVGTLQPTRNSDPSCASPHVLSSIWFSLLHVIMSTMSLLTCSSSSPTLQRAEHADDPDESLQNAFESLPRGPATVQSHLGRVARGHPATGSATPPPPRPSARPHTCLGTALLGRAPLLSPHRSILLNCIVHRSQSSETFF